MPKKRLFHERQTHSESRAVFIRLRVDFAAETDADRQKADQKRKNKNADLIVLNDVTRVGAGFGTETNIVTLISDDGIRDYPLMSKREVARMIINTVAQ